MNETRKLISVKLLSSIFVTMILTSVCMIALVYAPPPPAYAVILSSNDGSGLWNLGSITFDGASYSLSETIDVEAGTYTAQYFPESGYQFVEWTTVDFVSVDNIYANPVEVTVSGDGVLVAIFEELYEVILESHNPMTLDWGGGAIVFDGTNYDPPGAETFDVEAGTYTAEYIPEFGCAFWYWTLVNGLSMPDIYANPGEVTVFDDAVLVAIYEEVPAIESCDSYGETQNSFLPNPAMPEQVAHVKGTNLPPGPINIYLVEDVTWVNQMSIPPKVSQQPGTSHTVDSSGNIAHSMLYMVTDPLPPGKYDLIADVDGDGKYDEGVDALDDLDVNGAGFFVIPEVVIGSIMAVAAMFTALGLYAYKKKHKSI